MRDEFGLFLYTFVVVMGIYFLVTFLEGVM